MAVNKTQNATFPQSQKTAFYEYHVDRYSKCSQGRLLWRAVYDHPTTFFGASHSFSYGVESFPVFLNTIAGKYIIMSIVCRMNVVF